MPGTHQREFVSKSFASPGTLMVTWNQTIEVYFSWGNDVAHFIRLTDEEIAEATAIGKLRQAEAVRKGLKPAHGFKGDEAACEKIHIMGALGEMAAAKCLGIPWDGTVNTFKSRGDLGDIEVRTRSRHEWDLKVCPEDHDDRRFVLVTVENGEYRVHGWMRGGDAKQPWWIRTYGGRPEAYFVPRRFLNPIETVLAA